MSLSTGADDGKQPSGRDPVWQIMEREPYRAFTVEELMRILKPQAVKDPQKQSQASEEMTASLNRLIERGRVREVGSGLFKARLFLDKAHNIEHATIGGVENILYRFRSPLFRLNIGVLSLYFIKEKKKGDWTVTVRDTTIGKDYCLVRKLRDGAHVFGNRPSQAGDDHYCQIEGRYIENEHVTITISGDAILVEDHKTLYGTRIGHFTEEGLARYQEAAKEFLQQTAPSEQINPVKRGRFVLERLLHYHQDFETTFFNTVADSLLR